MMDTFSRQEETNTGPISHNRLTQPSLPEFEGIDIKRYLSLFFNNWYWFFIALFISVSLAYGINRYSEKLYTVSASLLIKDDQIGGGLVRAENFIPGGDIFRIQQNLKNEMGILRSFKLNHRVIETMPELQISYVGLGRRNIVERLLYKDCPFKVISDSIDNQPVGPKVKIMITSDSTYDIEIDDEYNINRTREKFETIFREGGFSFIIRLRDPEGYKYSESNSNKYFFRFEDKELLASTYKNKLIINPIEEGASLVNLSVSGASAYQEADYLNKLMDLYIDQGMEAKTQTADSTITFINRQLDIISDSLERASQNLENFRLNNKIIDLSSEGRLIKERLERFENEKITLVLQSQYFQYLKDYLNSKDRPDDIISPSVLGVSDPILVVLIQGFAVLKTERQQLNMNISSSFPPVVLLDQKIEIAKKALFENVNSSIENINSSLKDVSQRIFQVEGEIKGLPKTEGQLIKYQRSYDLNNTVYTYLLEKKSEAGIAKASSVSDNRIIDRARVNSSYIIKPKTKQNLALAFVLGLLLPMILIAMIDYLNNKIIDRRDIEKGTNAPIIGYISHNDIFNELPVIEKPGSALAESFRSIRTALGFFMRGNNHPVISITSTISSEGKTFVSVNLAAITASLGKKVLLIGLDLRKPRIHKVFEIENSMGLSNYLAGNCTYEAVIQETPIKNLFYAPSGPVPPNPAELIESDLMKIFLAKARIEFDTVIIDTPPVAIVTDALLLADLADINLFVVRQRYSSKNTLGLIEEMYQNRRLKNIAIVINDISLSGYYGYGLRYGYTMGYGYSYGNNYYGFSNYSRYGYSEKGHEYYTD